MKIDRIKLSREVNAFGLHYWVGLEAEISENEDAVEGLKKLDGKIELFCNPVIQASPIKEKYKYKEPDELPVIDVSKQ